MTREEAIKYLIKPVATSTEIGEEKQKESEAYDMAIEALIERKKGKWFEKSVFDVDNNDYRTIEEWQSAKCSVCGKYHTTPYLYNFDNFAFCPNCGADMRGGEEC